MHIGISHCLVYYCCAGKARHNSRSLILRSLCLLVEAPAKPDTSRSRSSFAPCDYLPEMQLPTPFVRTSFRACEESPRSGTSYDRCAEILHFVLDDRCKFWMTGPSSEDRCKFGRLRPGFLSALAWQICLRSCFTVTKEHHDIGRASRL